MGNKQTERQLCRVQGHDGRKKGKKKEKIKVRHGSHITGRRGDGSQVPVVSQFDWMLRDSRLVHSPGYQGGGYARVRTTEYLLFLFSFFDLVYSLSAHLLTDESVPVIRRRVLV